MPVLDRLQPCGGDLKAHLDSQIKGIETVTIYGVVLEIVRP